MKTNYEMAEQMAEVIRNLLAYGSRYNKAAVAVLKEYESISAVSAGRYAEEQYRELNNSAIHYRTYAEDA